MFQWTEPDDRVRPAVWTHRRAVWTKEAIGRMTFLSVVGEFRLGLPLYRWAGAHGAADVPADVQGHLSA